MRNLAVLALLALLSLPACAPIAALSTGGGQSSASLGPDGGAVTESASTLPERITSGLTWLWSSYTALKAKGLDVSALREAISEMQEVVQRGDLAAALSLYGKARTIVTEVAR